jgi:acetoin utilization deacetylase AcuC-like enzyme
MRPTGLDVPDRGGEDRSVIDLLRNVVAAVARFFAPRAVVVSSAS